MDTEPSGPTLRRRPSIHRSWNTLNLTDDQKKQVKMPDVATPKSMPSSPVIPHPERVSYVEGEDSTNESDQESLLDSKDDNSSGESDSESDDYIYHNIDKEKLFRSAQHIILIGTLSAVFMLSIVCLKPDIYKFADLQSIKENFPTQDEDLWIAFEAGVLDVVIRERPSTFILLYEEEAKEVVNELVHHLSRFAACNITKCGKEPIEVNDAELNSEVVVRDYGTLIEKYRDKLQEKGVMVIKNLENVRGISAQAFHSFCDEFAPLVQKSLFIFTMKVDELPKTSDRMKFIEEYFRSKWTDIKMDTFNALITRITSMVLEIRSQPSK